MKRASLDDRTFEDAVRQHGAMVARIVSTYEVRPALAEELVQDVFTALWRALPAFRGDSSLKTFVARIAHNVSISHVRKEVRMRHVELDDAMPAHADGPHEETERNLARERLLQAVRRLPLGQRRVVSLHLEGFANKDIAQVLDLSEGNVAVRLNRARGALTDLMGGVR
ncbi:MAG: sigma-70 family RNA polymerase sigma factor [Parvularcula sp.]|nr:sigma-70 family RNA polymerase sigma factor [Parvularcula sp.]